GTYAAVCDDDAGYRLTGVGIHDATPHAECDSSLAQDDVDTGHFAAGRELHDFRPGFVACTGIIRQRVVVFGPAIEDRTRPRLSSHAYEIPPRRKPVSAISAAIVSLQVKGVVGRRHWNSLAVFVDQSEFHLFLDNRLT